MTNTFQIGKTYSMRSVCDHECIWTFKVQSRTAKFVTLVDREGKTRRAGVRTWSGVECCSPLGQYSMAPVLSADKAA